MTCIVGLECSDGAVIAGDYCASNSFIYSSMVPPKVFRHSGIVFGYTATFRFGQIIEHVLDNNSLHPPKDPDETYRWLVKDFVPKLQKILTDEEYNKGKGCNAVLILNGQAWELQDDMSVLRNDMGLAVVGSGTYHATSSIITQLLLKYPNKRPTMDEAEEILKTAYYVTASCVTSVSEKCEIIKDGV